MHRWFSRKPFAERFEAQYRNALQDWQPRDADSQLAESVWELSSNRFSSDELGSQSVTGQGQWASPLCSIREQHEEHGSGRGQQFKDAFPRSGADSIDESLGRLSLEPEHGGEEGGRYMACGEVQIHASPIAGDDSQDAPAAFDSIYPFSIPGPPPLTPEDEEGEEEAVIIPETPIRPVKTLRQRSTVARLREQVRYGHDSDDGAGKRKKRWMPYY
jgi:hypothetical protein